MYHIMLLTSKMAAIFNQYYEKLFTRVLYRIISISVHQDVPGEELQKRVNHLKADQLTEEQSRKLPERNIKLPASFRGILVHRTIMNHSAQLPEWVLNHKPTGQRFAASISLKTPKIYQQSVLLRDLQFIENTVIKPVSGASSRGVYIVIDATRIYEVSTQSTLKSKDALFKNLKKYVPGEGGDKWIVEEYISKDNMEPAHDIKFYSFYGETGAVVEINRFPATKYCWWDGSGKYLGDVSTYDRELFKGSGVTWSELEVAKNVSLEIPAPFIRIDFLKGRDGICFGEFTPRPGGFANFEKSMDIHLGHCFLQAQARLNRDLINGKRFEAFREFYN